MMKKIILVTGSTDGIGLETAWMLVALGQAPADILTMTSVSLPHPIPMH